MDSPVRDETAMGRGGCNGHGRSVGDGGGEARESTR
jgi:hypothetical protein